MILLYTGSVNTGGETKHCAVEIDPKTNFTLTEITKDNVNNVKNKEDVMSIPVYGEGNPTLVYIGSYSKLYFFMYYDRFITLTFSELYEMTGQGIEITNCSLSDTSNGKSLVGKRGATINFKPGADDRKDWEESDKLKLLSLISSGCVNAISLFVSLEEKRVESFISERRKERLLKEKENAMNVAKLLDKFYKSKNKDFREMGLATFRWVEETSRDTDRLYGLFHGITSFWRSICRFVDPSEGILFRDQIRGVFVRGYRSGGLGFGHISPNGFNIEDAYYEALEADIEPTYTGFKFVFYCKGLGKDKEPHGYNVSIHISDCGIQTGITVSLEKENHTKSSWYSFIPNVLGGLYVLSGENLKELKKYSNTPKLDFSSSDLIKCHTPQSLAVCRGINKIDYKFDVRLQHLDISLQDFIYGMYRVQAKGGLSVSGREKQLIEFNDYNFAEVEFDDSKMRVTYYKEGVQYGDHVTYARDKLNLLRGNFDAPISLLEGDISMREYEEYKEKGWVKLDSYQYDTSSVIATLNVRTETYVPAINRLTGMFYVVFGCKRENEIFGPALGNVHKDLKNWDKKVDIVKLFACKTLEDAIRICGVLNGNTHDYIKKLKVERVEGRHPEVSESIREIYGIIGA